MATVNVTDTDSFTLAESVEDINGSATNKTQSETFTFTEIENVHVLNSFPYYPPFNVAVVPMIYTASFQGNRGYEEPTTFLHLTNTGAYPRINAQLFDVTDQPLNLTTLGVTAITFDVACADGTFVSRACTTDTAALGKVHFSWGSTTPLGSHPARFTLAISATKLSVPTWPLTVVVREAPHA